VALYLLRDGRLLVAVALELEAEQRADDGA
jgi:hypothetical protein